VLLDKKTSELGGSADGFKQFWWQEIQPETTPAIM
jgi:hypothetical protein